MTKNADNCNETKQTTVIDKFDPVVYGSGELTFVCGTSGKLSSLAEADKYLENISPEPRRERMLTDYFIDVLDAAALTFVKPFSAIAAIAVTVLGIVLDPIILVLLVPAAMLGAIGFIVPKYYMRKAEKCDKVFECGKLHCAELLRIKPRGFKVHVTYSFFDNGRKIVHTRKFIADDDDMRRLRTKDFIVVSYDRAISRSVSIPVIPITETA